MSMLSKIPSKYLKGHHIEAGEIVTIKEVCDEKVGVAQGGPAGHLFRRV